MSTDEQAKKVIECGEIVQQRLDSKPYLKCTVAGMVSRTVAGVEITDELYVAVAVGPYLLFMTGYWKNDRPDRKARRRR